MFVEQSHHTRGQQVSSMGFIQDVAMLMFNYMKNISYDNKIKAIQQYKVRFLSMFM